VSGSETAARLSGKTDEPKNPKVHSTPYKRRMTSFPLLLPAIFPSANAQYLKSFTWTQCLLCG